MYFSWYLSIVYTSSVIWKCFLIIYVGTNSNLVYLIYRYYWFTCHELTTVHGKSYLRGTTFCYCYLFMNWKEVTSLKMFLRIISIVFLFLVHLGFSSHLSTVQVIRNRYGNEVVKLMWKFERLNFRC